MLVLSRQRDECIMIGDNIVVTIVDIRGDKVRLGIQAPTEIPVHRQEVYEAIQREICVPANCSRAVSRPMSATLNWRSPSVNAMRSWAAEANPVRSAAP